MALTPRALGRQDHLTKRVEIHSRRNALFLCRSQGKWWLSLQAFCGHRCYFTQGIGKNLHPGSPLLFLQSDSTPEGPHGPLTSRRSWLEREAYAYLSTGLAVSIRRVKHLLLRDQGEGNAVSIKETEALAFVTFLLLGRTASADRNLCLNVCSE